MKLPLEVEISDDKIKNYLLLKRDIGDKSQFLFQVGYAIENYDTLVNDLREQFLPLEALLIEETVFGKKYKIESILTGPNGKALLINTIWMIENMTNKGKFITLFPSKEKTK